MGIILTSDFRSNNPRIKKAKFIKDLSRQYGFDGYRLDSLKIEVDLFRQSDFDDLIDLLNVHKMCFWTPEIQEKMYCDVCKKDVNTTLIKSEYNKEWTCSVCDRYLGEPLI